MALEELAENLVALDNYFPAGAKVMLAEAAAHLRRLAALERDNARLRERLERAEVVLRALCDDHVRTEMRAHGRSVGDTLAALAREALEPVEGGDGTSQVRPPEQSDLKMLRLPDAQGPG